MSLAMGPRDYALARAQELIAEVRVLILDLSYQDKDAEILLAHLDHLTHDLKEMERPHHGKP